MDEDFVNSKKKIVWIWFEFVGFNFILLLKIKELFFLIFFESYKLVFDCVFK